jgi:hypothetical protein
MENVFDSKDVTEILERINQLTPKTQAQWGQMTVAQMLSHCNVTYEMIYTQKHPRPNFIMAFVLKKWVKDAVVSDEPYPKNGKTAAHFLVTDIKDFTSEKIRLTDHIHRTLKLGGDHFNGLESHSLGVLTEKEWNNLFSKHLDHHLRQFGV